MDFLNAIVALCNYVIVPGVTYGSQLALGALGVTLIYSILRFSNFATVGTVSKTLSGLTWPRSAPGPTQLPGCTKLHG